LLQRIGFIERAGKGIGRMRDELVAHGSPEPVFEANSFFTATFRPPREKEFAFLREQDERDKLGRCHSSGADSSPAGMVALCRRGGRSR